jgi:hypothetical protein
MCVAFLFFASAHSSATHRPPLLQPARLRPTTPAPCFYLAGGWPLDDRWAHADGLCRRVFEFEERELKRLFSIGCGVFVFNLRVVGAVLPGALRVLKLNFGFLANLGIFW